MTTDSKDKAWGFLHKKHDDNYISSPQKFSFHTVDDIDNALDITIKSEQDNFQKEKEEIFNDEELSNLIIMGLMEKYDNDIEIVNQKYKELKQRLLE